MSSSIPTKIRGFHLNDWLPAIFIAGIVIFAFQYMPFNPNYRMHNQCVVDSIDDTGDSMCYNYKLSTYEDDWFDVPTSAKIAERSGADMNRFADYQCGNNFRGENGDEYCASIGRKTLFKEVPNSSQQ